MTWYNAFAAAVLLLWAFASPKDRPALRVILLATISSYLITEGITRQIHATWKLVIPATVETVTILALLRWASGRTGYLQAGLLVIAWFAHALCYLDLVRGTDWVYSNYETILAAVAVGQIVACHDTISTNLRRLGHWLLVLRPPRVAIVRAASVRSAILPDQGGARLQTLP